MTSEMKEREAFEMWVLSIANELPVNPYEAHALKLIPNDREDHPLYTEQLRYRHDCIQWAWEAWKARGRRD